MFKKYYLLDLDEGLFRFRLPDDTSQTATNEGRYVNLRYSSRVLHLLQYGFILGHSLPSTNVFLKD